MPKGVLHRARGRGRVEVEELSEIKNGMSQFALARLTIELLLFPSCTIFRLSMQIIT